MLGIRLYPRRALVLECILCPCSWDPPLSIKLQLLNDLELQLHDLTTLHC